MATSYSELQTEIAQWLDNTNPNLLASIPSFISDAEKRLSRLLLVQEMQCRVTHSLVPSNVTDASRGRYALPNDWVNTESVEVRGDLIALLYYQAIPALNNVTQTTNWLLDKYPDLYRFASLESADVWLKNDQRSSVWAGRAQSIVNEVINTDLDGRLSGGPLKTRTERNRFWRASDSNDRRLEYLPVYDFLDLESRGTHMTLPYYFSVYGGKIHIYPKPGGEGSDPAGWSACQ